MLASRAMVLNHSHTNSMGRREWASGQVRPIVFIKNIAWYFRFSPDAFAFCLTREFKKFNFFVFTRETWASSAMQIHTCHLRLMWTQGKRLLGSDDVVYARFGRAQELCLNRSYQMFMSSFLHFFFSLNSNMEDTAAEAGEYAQEHNSKLELWCI